MVKVYLIVNNCTILIFKVNICFLSMDVILSFKSYCHLYNHKWTDQILPEMF